MNVPEQMLIGDVADTIGIQSWRLRRLIERKLIDPPKRIGRISVFTRDDVPIIAAAAKAAGYLRQAEPVG